jgi:hypothetical protein
VVLHGSNSRSSRVRGVDTASSVPEYTTLSRAPPHLGEVRLGGRQPGLVADRLPDGHRLVHAPAVEVGADGPLEVVDELVHLGVGHRPVEPALLVLYVASRDVIAV